MTALWLPPSLPFPLSMALIVAAIFAVLVFWPWESEQ